MIGQCLSQQALDQSASSNHNNSTNGQFRWGGFVTSYCVRRSRLLGRVAVAYVQGSPKGGGALGTLGVTNTRLRPVPPFEMGVSMRRIAKQIYSMLLISTVFASPASAQAQSQIERRYTSEYHACMDASEGVTVAMMDCNGAEIELQDARLNQAYVMVMRPLARAKKDALRALQRAWIKQRDAKCSRAADAERGGSLASVIYSGCILDETIKRTIFLENYRG